jgi:hypothetical protein
MWLPTSEPPLVLRRLAFVLWWDRVRAEVEEARKGQVRTYAGVAMPLFQQAGLGRWGGASVKDTDTGPPVLVDRHGVTLARSAADIVRAVPSTDLVAMEAWTRSGAELLGTVDAHRFLLETPSHADQQQYQRGPRHPQPDGPFRLPLPPGFPQRI